MANKFTLQERTQIALKFEAWQSEIAVQHWWRQMHGRRAIISTHTIHAYHDRLVTTGNIYIRKQGEANKEKQIIGRSQHCHGERHPPGNSREVHEAGNS